MMASGKDYYKILGVASDASAEVIKKRYRDLARELHPDKTRGDRKLEERFKEVSEAYSVLGDSRKRDDYDAMRESLKVTQGGGDFSGGGFEDLFSDLFNRYRDSNRRDLSLEIKVPLKSIIKGGEVDLDLREYGYGLVNVKIPLGCYQGSVLKLSGRGLGKFKGGGDINVVIDIEDHPVFTVRGRDVFVVVPVSVVESVLGGEIEVLTIYGERLLVRIKEGVKSGKRLRLPGKGINGGGIIGDMYVIVDIEPYNDISKKAKRLLTEFNDEVGKDVRKKFLRDARL